MRWSLIKLAVITNLAMFIFLAAGNIPAQVKQTSPKWEKKNCLREVEKSLPTGVEKSFFLSLEKRETENIDLIEALGLIKYVDLQQPNLYPCPGQEIPIGDGWFAFALRPELLWKTTVITGNDTFHLLFYQENTINRFRPTDDCVIATTDINYQINSWIESGCYPDFINASIEKVEDGFIFKITAKAEYAGKDLRVSRYKITSNKITWIPPSD